jgi:hypothetical protein
VNESTALQSIKHKDLFMKCGFESESKWYHAYTYSKLDLASTRLHLLHDFDFSPPISQ